MRGAPPDPTLDPYLVLGVGRTATDAEIRAAYLALVARYHPDRHQGNPLEELASARMTEINRAYELLSHPTRRAAHDGVAWRGAPGRAPAERAGGREPRAGDGRWMTSRVTKVVALLIALPLILRLAGGIGRALGGLGRILFEGLAFVRGTPVVAVAALLATAALVFGVVVQLRRWRRLGRTGGSNRARR